MLGKAYAKARVGAMMNKMVNKRWSNNQFAIRCPNLDCVSLSNCDVPLNLLQCNASLYLATSSYTGFNHRVSITFSCLNTPRPYISLSVTPYPTDYYIGVAYSKHFC